MPPVADAPAKSTSAPTLGNWMDVIKENPITSAIAVAPTEPPPAQPPAQPAPNPSATPNPPPVQPPEPPKTPEPAAAEGQDGPKWPRTAKDWDSYKKASKEREEAIAKERDAIKAERDSVKAEIEKLQKQGPSADLEALKKERDELSEKLRLVAVENHPKFKAHFEGRTNAQIELAKRIVGTEKATRIAEILKTPEGAWRDSQMDDFIADLNPMQQSRLGGVINALSEIGMEREREIANAKTTYERMTTEHKTAQERQQKEFKDNAEKAFSSELSSLEDAKNPAGFLFQKKDGNEAWNKEITERVESAKNLLFGKSNPETLTRAAFHAAAFPAVLKYAIERSEQVGKLEAQVKALTASNPTAESHGNENGNGGAGPVTIKPGTNPMQAADAWVRGLRESARQ